MSESELNRLIAERIRYYMDQKNVSQAEMAEALGVSQQAVSTWCQGIKMPRMDKIDKICSFLGVTRSALMQENYYYEEETARIAQEIFEDKDLRALMSAARDANPAAIKAAHAFLKTLKEQELNWHNEDE